MPCCRQRQLKNPCDIPEDFICNHLSGGYCEPLSRIGNLYEYVKLTKNLSVTNIKKRISQYQGIVEYSISERITYWVVFGCFGSLFLLAALVSFCYARWAMNYVPVGTADVPTWNQYCDCFYACMSCLFISFSIKTVRRLWNQRRSNVLVRNQILDMRPKHRFGWHDIQAY